MMLLIISLGQQAQIRVAPGKPGSLEPHTVPDTVLSIIILIHEHGLSFHLLVSSLHSFIHAL